MPSAIDARRRWFGLFFLIVAGGMLIWGQTVLRAHLRGWGFLVYWLACFAFTVLAILTALLDIWMLRRQSRQARRELFQRTFGELTSEGEKPAAPQAPATKPRPSDR
jgi:hypothetical protein